MQSNAYPCHVRTIFISDVHLGAAACQTTALLGFLRRYKADVIYLTGDILEGWRTSRCKKWPRAHRLVLAELFSSAQLGVRVVYLPGNHDDYARNLVGITIGGIEITESVIHECADGRRYLVLHGDQFDSAVRRIRWLSQLGYIAYCALIALNRQLGPFWRRLGPSGESCSVLLKLCTKRVINVVGHSEPMLVAAVRRRGADGVICGHTHHAESRDISGIHYVNTGDWVESCTGVVEHDDGVLELIHWPDKIGAASVLNGTKNMTPDRLQTEENLRHAV